MDKTRRSLRLIGVVVAVGALIVGAAVAYRAFEARQTEQRWALLATYCTECHSDEEFAGNVVFEGLTPESVSAHAATFEAAVRKLRGRLMPPPGNPQPDQAEIDALVTFLERSIDSQSQAPSAVHVPIQRLNRTEYALAVKDLLGIDIDAEEALPTEIEVDGFTNIAAALSTSPAFLEQYISVARTVAHLAVGTPNPKLASAYFPPPTDDQDGYVDSLPLGTRGGTRFEHNFPADGEYHIDITDLDVGLYPRSLETEHTLVILVDRSEVFRAKLGGPADLELVDRGGAPARAELMQRFANIPIRVAAGVHEVVVTFIERARASTDEPIFGFTPYGGFSFRGQMRVPRVIGGIEVEGPFGATGLSRTASRDKIFVCQPESPAEERACAERITATLARRAFRRPVDQADVARLMPFYEAGRQGAGGFDGGIERMITALLASPDFLYRGLVSRQPAGAAEIYALSDLDLASRLSFFLWSQGPDEELLDLASAGRLHDARVVRAQAKRMLADPRAEALVTGFALAWLNLDELESVDPDDRLFPEFSDELRADFETEIRLFLSSVLLGDENVQSLLTADYTFLNERLAKHYGITGVRGPQFRRVTLDDERRYGLLGKAAVLMRTSYGDRTSPVLRGAWVLEKLMGTPPTPPPAGVETDLSTPAGEQPKTLRVRLERHRSAPNCNACHGVFDPYGLALENFTVIGQWREYDREADAPIDAKTALPSGVVVAGPVELREALLRRDDQFVQALTQKLMMYALGRELEYHDMPQVRAIVHAAAKDDYRLSAIVAGIVSSPAFRMQAPAHEAAGDEQTSVASNARGDERLRPPRQP
jgi:hypothetical protein